MSFAYISDVHGGESSFTCDSETLGSYLASVPLIFLLCDSDQTVLNISIKVYARIKVETLFIADNRITILQSHYHHGVNDVWK